MAAKVSRENSRGTFHLAPYRPGRDGQRRSALSTQAWHLVAQMPLVRGAAPKTPKVRIASQIETHFMWEVRDTRKRNWHVSVWLNDAELGHLRRQAAAAGLGVDPFLRSLILGVELRPRPPDTYAALLRELSAIGNNINQIAHIANAERHISDDRIDSAVNLMNDVWRCVRSYK